MNEQPKNEQDGEPAIAFQNVVKGFGDRKVLDGVTFQVNPGEALCILGRSGTGKSVTLKLTIGLLKADSGKVMVQGKDMGALDEKGLTAVRMHMGYMFQNAALFDSFDLTANLAMPLHRLHKSKTSEQIKQAVEDTLKQVGLEKDGNKMPASLSGGMQKRAGLARALVLDPQIMLIDEPSSGLDVITASEITDLLKKVKTEKHTTMVVVTHDIEGARELGDKFGVLDGSKLVAFGTLHELEKSDNELVKRFLSEGQGK